MKSKTHVILFKELRLGIERIENDFMVDVDNWENCNCNIVIR